MRSTLLIAPLALLFTVTLGSAAAVKDREGAVRGDKAKMESDARWLYNDVDRGFAEAKATGKPLLVVLRCIPCLSCVGLDAAVLQEPELAPLLDEFVCVRLINANAIDLARFQFDYDLSFSTLFFNADGTLYGRYGSWVHQVDPDAKETIGYRRALEGALALHRGYPANRAALAGKQGEPVPFRTPVEIPELAKKYGRELNWGGNVVQSCVHCHQVGEAFRGHYREQGEPVPPARIYPMPAAETIGLSLAPDQAATVTAVAPGSIAARAGFRAGDAFASFAGQPLISVADFSWVLHGAPEAGTIAAVVRRDGKEWPLTLALPAGWRSQSDISRRVGTWSMRAMAFGGLTLTDLDAGTRQARGLGAEGLALLVKGMGNFNKHGLAKKSGFLKDDVIVSFAGETARLSEGELIGRVLAKTTIGETVEVTVLRGTERVALTLPMQ
ncbi:MAG: Trx7/PDZ domain-containing (seleno)protein [Opitutaceae bacterium]|nr:Trx7/PDZ domain-containing (seleno)protein [Opitutaceae bacterium]